MASGDLFLLPLAFQWRCFLFITFDFKVLFFPVDANGWCPRAGAFLRGIQDSIPRSKKAGERMHVSVTRSGVS